MNIQEEDWCHTDYANDIVQTLQARELSLPEFRFQSPQLYIRRRLVDWLTLVANRFSLCDGAFHLCVYLLDRFMDNHDIEETRLQLVGLGCLSVASKFEEKDVKVPRLNEFRKLCHNTYTLPEFLQIELLILQHFRWELCVPTATHFVDYFIVAALPTDSLSKSPPSAGCDELSLSQAQFRNYVKYFLDMSLQDYQFARFKPSMVAASCLSSSRKCLRLRPTWPIEAQKLCRYALKDVKPCMDILLQAHYSDEQAARVVLKRKLEDDSGIEDSPSTSECKSDSGLEDSPTTSDGSR